MARGMLEALAVAAAKNIHGNRQLISAQLRLAGNFVGKDVDQFHHPIGIRAGGGGEKIGDRRTADPHRRGEHRPLYTINTSVRSATER